MSEQRKSQTLASREEFFIGRDTKAAVAVEKSVKDDGREDVAIFLKIYKKIGEMTPAGQRFPKPVFHNAKERGKEDVAVAMLLNKEASPMINALRAFYESGLAAAKQTISGFNKAAGVVGAAVGSPETIMAFVHGAGTENQKEISVEVSGSSSGDYFIFRIRTSNEMESKARGHMASTKYLAELGATVALLDAIVATAEEARRPSGAEKKVARATATNKAEGRMAEVYIGNEKNPELFGKIFFTICNPANKDKEKDTAMLSFAELMALKTVLKSFGEGGAEAAKAFIKRYNANNYPVVNNDTAIKFEHKSSKKPKNIFVEAMADGIGVTFDVAGKRMGIVLSGDNVALMAGGLEEIVEQAALAAVGRYSVAAANAVGEEKKISVVGSKVPSSLKRLKRDGFAENPRVVDGEFPWPKSQQAQDDKKAPAPEIHEPEEPALPEEIGGPIGGSVDEPAPAFVPGGIEMY